MTKTKDTTKDVKTSNNKRNNDPIPNINKQTNNDEDNNDNQVQSNSKKIDNDDDDDKFEN